MKFVLSWLKEFVEFKVSPRELAERLTMSGLEVESLECKGEGLEGVVVAQIQDIRPHPNASKLVLCDVSDGTKLYNIVCGAKNMKTGDKVALAPSGTQLPRSFKFPEGLLIKSTKIRGELSEGMLCAENELGISEESEGIMILPDSVKVGSKLIEALGLDEVIIEIGVTPNRPDCLSVIGVAREVAAIFGTKLKYPVFHVLEEGGDIADLAAVEVLDTDRCPRYSFRVITDVKIAPSPDWLKTRLEASGIRSINNVVEVTNLVLLELGQPLHAFDLDLIHGKKIIVRTAKKGEIITTLDGVERHLTEEDLVICDAEMPVAIAGVMGGGNTEVSETTRNILLESAYFNPASVRRTSKRTNLRSESSYRFERGVDPNGVVNALDRASQLIGKLTGGKVARGKIDFYPHPIEEKEVSLSTDRTNSILGTVIEPEKIKKIIEGIGIETLKLTEDEMRLRIPTFRVDLTREIDLIEEVARHFGYNNLRTTLPVVRMNTDEAKKDKASENRAKDLLASFGFLEVINYSFDDPEFLSLFDGYSPIRILNPISNDSSAMRTSLTPGIIKNIILNLNRQAHDIRIFELGRVYIPSEKGLPDEVRKIAGAATGIRQQDLWGDGEFDFFDLKAVLERVFEVFSVSDKVEYEEASQVRFLHPGKAASVMVGNKNAGYLGEIHPDFCDKLGISKRVYLFELDLEILFGCENIGKKKFSPLPKFPSVRRDVALIVDELVPVGEILKELKNIDSDLIEEVAVFDVFKGGSVERGKKSVAVSMTLRSGNRTLTDSEVDEVQTRGLRRLQSALGAELRKM